MNDPKFYDKEKPTWCPGCGDYGVLMALKKAAAELNLDPANTVVVTGIGCSAKLSSYFYSYGLHGIHGRALALATGVKLANPQLTVIAAGGDGDGYAIGMEHFMHTAKRNIDITYVIMDNQIYGLTKGQFSPTSNEGFVTNTSPFGNIETPVNGPLLALAAGATYIARGFVGDINQVAELIKGGIEHRGFSLIDIFSPCVTWNKVNTYDWYKANTYDLRSVNHDFRDKQKAFEVLLNEQKFPLGLIYKEENKKTYESLALKHPEKPMALQKLKDPKEYESLLDVFV
ncbi:MAG: 2-oxoacid:ferredoxin oxidoreductase subunit beta [Thermoplasmata archaeon]